MLKWLIRNKRTENMQSVSLPNLHNSSKNSSPCHKAFPNKVDCYGAPASTSVEQIKKSDSTLKLFEKMSKYQHMLQTELFEELSAIEGRTYLSPKLNVRHSLSKSEDVENFDLQRPIKEKHRRRHSSPVVPSYFYKPTHFFSSNKEEAREKDLSILQMRKFSDVKVYNETNGNSYKFSNHVGIECYNRGNDSASKCTYNHNKTDEVNIDKYNDQKSDRDDKHNGDDDHDDDDDDDDHDHDHDDDYDDHHHDDHDDHDDYDHDHNDDDHDQNDDDDDHHDHHDHDHDDDHEEDDVYKEDHDTDNTSIIPREDELFHNEFLKSSVYKSRRTSSPGLLGIKLNNEQRINTNLPQIIVENDNSNYR